MSQGTDSSLATWSVPQCLFSIDYVPRVLDDIRLTVIDAFFSLPRGGAEIGGLLLGRFASGRLSITGYRPVECEHAFGPSYTLSERDTARLQEAIDAAGVLPGDPQPVGWYHSHTRSEIFLSEVDREIHDRYFPNPWQVALVVRPHTFQPTRGGFFFREAGGHIHAESSYQEFEIGALGLGAAPLDAPAAAQSGDRLANRRGAGFFDRAAESAGPVPPARRDAVSGTPGQSTPPAGRDAVAEKPVLLPPLRRDAAAGTPGQSTPPAGRDLAADGAGPLPRPGRDAAAGTPGQSTPPARRDLAADGAGPLPRPGRDAAAGTPGQSTPPAGRNLAAEKPVLLRPLGRDAAAEKPVILPPSRRDAVAGTPGQDTPPLGRDLTAEKPVILPPSRRDAVTETVGQDAPPAGRYVTAEGVGPLPRSGREAVAGTPGQDTPPLGRDVTTEKPGLLPPARHDLAAEGAGTLPPLGRDAVSGTLGQGTPPAGRDLATEGAGPLPPLGRDAIAVMSGLLRPSRRDGATPPLPQGDAAAGTSVQAPPPGRATLPEPAAQAPVEIALPPPALASEEPRQALTRPEDTPSVASEPTEALASPEAMEEEPAPDSAMPRFLAAELPPSQRWRPLTILLIAAAIGACGYLTRGFWWTMATSAVHAILPAGRPAPLKLRVLDSNGQLQIQWDAASPALRDVKSARLIINDGPKQRLLSLDAAHLISGSFTYARENPRVEVSFLITPLNGDPFREQTTYLGHGPSPAAAPDPDIAKQLGDLQRQNQQLKSDLDKERQRNRKLDREAQYLRDLRERELRQKRQEKLQTDK